MFVALIYTGMELHTIESVLKEMKYWIESWIKELEREHQFKHLFAELQEFVKKKKVIGPQHIRKY